jgi:MSHA biogenesis protein MshO
LRRIGRDLRTAVPNSVRTPAPADSSYIEFLPTRDGGRYRVDPGTGTLCSAVLGNTNGDALNFSQPDGLNHIDTCFEIIGAPINLVSGDAIVIGSTQSDGSLPYLAVNSVKGVRRLVSAAGAGVGRTTVMIDSTVAFPASSELDGHRFEVVPVDQQAVTYACTGTLGTLDTNGDGQGSLTRYWAYGFNSAQQAPSALGGTSAILANKVSDCHFVYDTSNQRNSLLAVRLRITRGGESVNLYHEIHVNNIP